MLKNANSYFVGANFHLFGPSRTPVPTKAPFALTQNDGRIKFIEDIDNFFIVWYNERVKGMAPITKNGITKIIAYRYKGVTPIEKNIIVVDEQGNEYAATYPKRAKGLVKNGRARFVDENKICLACPPDKILEEEKMSNNTNNKSEQKVNGITEQQIFEQITLLQTQLTQNAQTSLHRLSDALDFIGEDNENELPYEQITEICNVFKTREITLLKLLEMYEKMYADIQIAKKVELIKTAFDNNMAFIESNEMDSGDTATALTYVTDKIAELLEKAITQ